MARQPRLRPRQQQPEQPLVNDIPRQSVSILQGTAGDDTLYDQLEYLRTVNTSSDRLAGGTGNDNIMSFGGRDTIDGGSGDDIINASGGTVFIDGGAGNDRAYVTFETTSAKITVSGDVGNGKTATFSDGTTITNIENFAVNLGQGSDDVTLGGGNVVIYGSGGDDRVGVRGGDGNTVDGGAGNDIVTGGTGQDSLGGGEGDDLVFGNGGNDGLIGGGGVDRLEGGAGNDGLDGGRGNDLLIGGAGADRFAINSGTNGIDRVLDFSFAEGDRLDAFFQFFDPESVDGSQPETVAAAFVSDPFAQGFLKATQVADGVFVSLVADPNSGLVIVGASLTDFSSEWLI